MKPKPLAALALVAVLAATLAGCGTPAYHYPKSSEHQLYFKVPFSWKPVNQNQIDYLTFGDPDSFKAQLKKKAGWAVGYDAAAEPDGAHFLVQYPTAAPAAQGFVVPLEVEEQKKLSFDELRDHFLPVSADFRRQLSTVPGFPLTDFELITDEAVNPAPGFRGVHVIYSYRLPPDSGGRLKTFDQLILTNDATDLLYGLLIQCSARCYLERQDEIRDVMSSLTVRSQA